LPRRILCVGRAEKRLYATLRDGTSAPVYLCQSQMLQQATSVGSWRAAPASGAGSFLSKRLVWRLTSLPGSRDCPRPETLSLLDFSHLRPHRYRHINHLLLFSSSLSIITSMPDNLMCSVDRTVVQSVAAVHLCLDFAPRAEATKLAGEVKTRCARFAAASRSP
jgi:hypothetical protein